eukprot:284043_1
MIPHKNTIPPNRRPCPPHSYNDQLMTRRCTRINLSRLTYSRSRRRTPIWDDFIYNIRSLLLLRIFLGILPQKPSPRSRNRSNLTTNRNHSLESFSRSTTQHRCPPLLRSNNNMSPPQNFSQKPNRSYSSFVLNSSSWTLLYRTPSMRIPRLPLYNSRQNLWINIFRSNRISRITCDYRNNVLIRMLSSPNKPPFFSSSPLRFRSCCLILTLCRRCLIILICLHLLMRLLKRKEESNLHPAVSSRTHSYL